MSKFEAMVESFNAGRVHDLVSSTTADYHYSDPINGRIDGAAAHEALMPSLLQRFPDRRIELLNCWNADATEFGRIPLERNTRERRRPCRDALCGHP